MHIDFTLRNIAYSILILIGVGWLAYAGAAIILPLIFAFIMALFLHPMDKKIRKVVKWPSISIILSMICVTLPLVILGWLFAFQFMEILDSLPTLGEDLEEGYKRLIHSAKGFIPALDFHPSEFIRDNFGKDSLNFLRKGFLSSTSLLISGLLTIIYTYFILSYKKSFKNFIIFQFEKQFRPEAREVLTKIKDIIQSYIGGLFIIVATLSVINSLGLWIIGIEYPFFWGILAGFLAIIPYIGTGLGGLLPFLYSLATYDHPWQPLAVVIFYATVQTLEGNILTPKIVGDKVNINPLFAILAIMFFGSLWGIGGVILALPLISILRIILSQFDTTEALAVLMSSDVEEKSGKFKKMVKNLD